MLFISGYPDKALNKLQLVLNTAAVTGLLVPGHLMQHYINLLLRKIAFTQPGGVLGHCPVEKQIIVPLSPNQMGWRIAAECYGRHAG